MDTSVLVAAFASWHPSHAVAARALEAGARIPAHVIVETYSVLTRLPPPHRAPARVVAEYLQLVVTESPLVLPGSKHLQLAADAARLGITGGSIHDALVAATAAHAGAVLVTLDRRAVPTYERLGVESDILA